MWQNKTVANVLNIIRLVGFVASHITANPKMWEIFIFQQEQIGAYIYEGAAEDVLKISSEYVQNTTTYMSPVHIGTDSGLGWGCRYPSRQWNERLMIEQHKEANDYFKSVIARNQQSHMDIMQSRYTFTYSHIRHCAYQQASSSIGASMHHWFTSANGVRSLALFSNRRTGESLHRTFSSAYDSSGALASHHEPCGHSSLY